MVTVIQYVGNQPMTYETVPCWDNEHDLYALCSICIIAGGCDRVVVSNANGVIMDVSA